MIDRREFIGASFGLLLAPTMPMSVEAPVQKAVYLKTKYLREQRVDILSHTLDVLCKKAKVKTIKEIPMVHDNGRLKIKTCVYNHGKSHTVFFLIGDKVRYFGFNI